MTFNYTRAKNSAVRLIARFGRSGTLRKFTDGGTAYAPTRTSQDHLCTCVLLDYRLRDVDGTLVKRGDRFAIISTDGLDGVTPSKDDKLLVGSDEYAIISLMPLEPGSTVLMWEAQVRQ